MIKWKKLAKSIPNFVAISKQVSYEIVYIDEFKDGKTLGETRFDPPQIVIKTNQTPKETVHTYIHEVVHAVSHEYGVGLTESQVLALESALTVILKQDNIFKE